MWFNAWGKSPFPTGDVLLLAALCFEFTPKPVHAARSLDPSERSVGWFVPSALEARESSQRLRLQGECGSKLRAWQHFLTQGYEDA